MGFFGKKNKEEDIKHDPDSLSFFFMDTMLCNQYYLQNEECMRDYLSRSGTPWSFVTGKNRKLHRQCLDYLD
jgi:hypothetical protein